MIFYMACLDVLTATQVSSVSMHYACKDGTPEMGIGKFL